eukprot:363024-Chlamydomonas_euryale.AAC.3
MARIGPRGSRGQERAALRGQKRSSRPAPRGGDVRLADQRRGWRTKVSPPQLRPTLIWQVYVQTAEAQQVI